MMGPVHGGHQLSAAVLGLGRLGTAVSARLATTGWSVTGWSRSGDGAAGIPIAESASDAVDAAIVVVLCLPNGWACRAVLDELAAGRALVGRVVINLSTVTPAEATDFAELSIAASARYVHAPIIGSVGAAAAGRLTVLAGPATEVGHVLPLLTRLGRVQEFLDPASAARAKMLADGTLAAALLAVKDGLQWAAELGMDEQEAVEVLSRSALGGLVRANRARINEQRFGGAGFTVSALADQVGLLADAAPSARPVADAVDLLVADLAPDSDVAALVGRTPRRSEG